MNDPYGLLASGLPPDMAAQLMGLNRREQVLQALMQQSMQTSQAPEVKGRFQGAISPLQPLAQMAMAFASARGLGDADKQMGDLATRRQQMVADALSHYQQTRDGSPGTPGVTNLVPNDDEGNALPTGATPGVPGDRRAAVMQAMVNPLLASNPLVSSDLKGIAKEAEPYSLKPNERRMVNNQVVASAPAAPAKVTTTDAAGNPVEKFVTPDVNAPPIPQPVKMDMVNVGDKFVPTNLFTQKDPLAKTVSPDEQLHAGVTVRGQNMTDARTRELNGILAGQNTDLGPTADAVANYDVPLRAPPANSRPAALASYNKLIAAVKERNPDWSEQNYEASNKAYKAFTSGPEAKSVRFLSVATDHLDTLKQAALAMQNGDTQLVNKVGNQIAQWSGKAAPVTMDAIRDIAMDEVVKGVVGAGGASSDRERAKETIGRASSPAQVLGVIGGYQDLMRGQLGGLQRQYEQGTGRKDFNRFVSDVAQQRLEGAKSGTSGGGNVIRFDSSGNMLP